MKITTLAISALAMIATADTAMAQARPAAAAAAPRPAAAAPPQIAIGPAIAGLCMLSVNQAIGASKVGGYVRTRMEQIVAQVRAELSPEDAAIGADAKALEAARPTLDQATYQSRGQALQGRVNVLRQKGEQRQQEIKATEDKSLNRIAQELEPIAQQLYQQKHCSVLIDKGSVMLANPDMDLTGSAVAAIDAKLQQFPIEREHLEAQAAPAR